MTKEKTTKADEKIFTFLRLGCVWSKDLPDCKLFFEDQETYKSKKIKTAQLEVCKDFFEKRLMTKSDNLEIEVKNRMDKDCNIIRGESISLKDFEKVLKESTNISDVYPKV